MHIATYAALLDATKSHHGAVQAIGHSGFQSAVSKRAFNSYFRAMVGAVDSNLLRLLSDKAVVLEKGSVEVQGSVVLCQGVHEKFLDSFI